MLYVVCCGCNVSILSHNFNELFLPIGIRILLYFYLHSLVILTCNLLFYCFSGFSTILSCKHCTLLVCLTITNTKREIVTIHQIFKSSTPFLLHRRFQTTNIRFEIKSLYSEVFLKSLFRSRLIEILHQYLLVRRSFF